MRAGKVTGARQEFAHDLAAGKDKRLFEENSPPLPASRVLCVEPAREGAVALAQGEDAPRVLDDGVHLGAVADDARVFVTLGRRELEFEYWIDGRFGPRGALHTLGAEYGLTDHLMADVSGRWFQESGGPFSFEQGFIEMRYRFGEEGERPVDFAVSVEYQVKRSVEERETHQLIEPRIVLSKDLGGWNFTANLFYSFVLDEKRRSAFEASLGARTPNFGRWNAGIELRR